MSKPLHCWFCGLESTSPQVAVLVQAAEAGICNDCVEICVEIITEHWRKRNTMVDADLYGEEQGSAMGSPVSAGLQSETEPRKS